VAVPVGVGLVVWRLPRSEHVVSGVVLMGGTSMIGTLLGPEGTGICACSSLVRGRPVDIPLSFFLSVLVFVWPGRGCGGGCRVGGAVVLVVV
jgi:hypothetical protein